MEQLGEVASVSSSQLLCIIRNKESYYESFFMKKKDGAPREINPPKPELAEIQLRLKNYLQKRLKWTNAVHGGIPKRSIITNAERHMGKLWVANLDISKFFPSTKPAQIESALQRAGCSTPVANLFAELTTFRNGLPQGSPTSTILSNLVLEPMDSQFLRLCHRNSLTYTRYIDDITISGDINLNPFYSAFIKIIQSSGFEVQTKKVHITPHSQRQVVTGLVVNDRLRPTGEFLSNLKRAIRRCWNGPEEIAIAAAEEGHEPREFIRSLCGKVNHVKSVDPKLGRKIRALCTKIPHL
jgi:retron-type reverse transcriptase